MVQGHFKCPESGGFTAPSHCPFLNLNYDGAKIWLPPSFGPRACSGFRPAPSRGVGSSQGGAPPLRVIRAVTVRYIRRWLVGWLLFRCLAPGFAGRALVLGNRPTGAGRFRVAGSDGGCAGGASSGRRNRKRGQPGKVGMKRKGGARITRDGAGAGENLTGVGVAPSVAPAIKPRAARAAASAQAVRRVRTDRVALPLVRGG